MSSLSRRELLAGGTALTLASMADARGLIIEPLLDRVVEAALEVAARAGAGYADVRLVRRRSESLGTRDDHVSRVGSSESYGLGVRVLVEGVWGFSASAKVDPGEARAVAGRAVALAKANVVAVKRRVELAAAPAAVDMWQTPLTKDPFRIPLEDKADLLLAIHSQLGQVPGVKFTSGWYEALGEWKYFASSEGSRIEQNITRVGAGYSATALGQAGGEVGSRGHDFQPLQGGWEAIESAPLLADARRIGEDAVEKLKAPSVTPGKRHLILAPSNLWLTIHESVGHPTELDRALGYEANFAGTSFATVDKLNKLRFAASSVTLYADKTTPGGLATAGYDDDGVKAQRWDLVKNGLFVGYQTTREQAGWIGEKASRGTCYADDFRSFPFQRMPNVSLAPGPKALGQKDLIAATEDGVLVVGTGSYSIDQQRYNFQFGGQMFYEVKKGRITRALKDVAYQANTVDFWNGLDLLGGEAEWQLGGSLYDGKGEPMQVNPVSHGCPPARFANVTILNTNRRGA